MKLPNKSLLIKHVTIYTVYLLIFWCFYRFLVRLPDDVEELVIKPIVWLVPILVLLGKERLGLSSIGITLKNIFPAIYLSLGLGAFFVMEAVLVNFLKHNGLNFGANIGGVFLPTLGLSFATAISEEIAFRGYIFGRLSLVLKNEWLANLISTTTWVAVHIPIVFIVWGYTLPAGLVYLFLTAIFGAGSAFVYARTGNIAASVFLHVLWEWPIILFR